MTGRTHHRLVAILTAHDRRLASRQRRPNPSRLALLFQALDRAEADTRPLAEALPDQFDGALLSSLSRAIGGAP